MANDEEWTVLHYSARNGSYDSVKLLADMGMDFYLKTKIGWNCLHSAALYRHGRLCKTLIDKHNFDVHVPDTKGGRHSTFL